jgi:hypothetical protein
LKHNNTLPLTLAVAAIFITTTSSSAQQSREQSDELSNSKTCFITGGGALEVCHETTSEGIFYRPSPTQVGYNVQIIRYHGAQYATVLHSEAKDTEHFYQLTGHLRPGDSIKSGTVDASRNPDASLSAPLNLSYRIWGSLTNVHSPLYYSLPPEAGSGVGISGGGNPMVVQGRRWANDDHFYMFFLGVESDEFRGEAWRNVLLEARTPDFIHFELLEDDGAGSSIWVPFRGDSAMPTPVKAIDGQVIQSNWPAYRAAAQTLHGPPAGSITTAGLIGSVVEYEHFYYYFYTDEDPVNPARNHLYVRTATDLSANGAWSAPQSITDTPPMVLVRVAKAVGMDRWAVLYNCLRSSAEAVSDICLQYTGNMKITGPGSLGDLLLLDRAKSMGNSPFALDLRGGNLRSTGGATFKAQHDVLTDREGALVLPDTARHHTELAGLLTWMDMPPSFMAFGAPTYWAEWEVRPIGEMRNARLVRGSH